ncbi:hypothetical protein KCU81_g9790, partial [Aureobasidium melanogenum]|uniref:Uncharacterized protein n=1 Tax=Aureobasidium melanogenum (strain CBS 110374) TaxID=1043003 RepID=A0A074VWP7_AURM1
MKPVSILLSLATAVDAYYVCPATLTAADAASITYGYKVQSLLDSYYSSIPVNASYFSDLPMASTQDSNGMTKAENTVTNVRGLAKQASLGKQAISELAQKASVNLDDDCQYRYPLAPNGTVYLKNAFYFEATMCGAFIGLADYVESPESAFLAARLSAEHGIHASALRAMMQPVGFMPNSTYLTPAFTPDMIMQEGMSVGQLGTWLNGCAKSPAAPCGGHVVIGDLLATLAGQNASMTSAGACPTATGGYSMGSNGTHSYANGTGTSSASQNASMTPQAYTGAAATTNAWASASLMALAFAVLLL